MSLVIIGYACIYFLNNENSSLRFDSKIQAQPPSIQITNFCDQIQNTKFQSVKKFERGLSANGKIAKGFETITFDQNKFDWSHSDFSESGTYLCKDNTLEVHFQEFQRVITARFDPGTQMLSWENHDFQIIR